MVVRRVIAVRGLVQGVGFRPFAYSLASDLALRGLVRNDATGVVLDLEGESDAIDRLVQRMSSEQPPLAFVESISTSAAPLVPHRDLRIAASEGDGERSALVSPDAATCDRCIDELFDPANRRHLHPFISCTHCGPRLTIVTSVPYDRVRTTMDRFAMCETCAREYGDPADRRFHAQPIACWTCGPALTFACRPDDQGVVGRAAIEAAAAALDRGEIVAVKGLGGYHLACDGTDAQTVLRLRARKHREAKPFAIMVRNIKTVRALCHVNDAEAALLCGPMRPIVLLQRHAGAAENGLAIDAIAPNSRQLGVMLPYTPVHHLLLAASGRALVMTSGNRADEPIATDDRDAFNRLGAIADAFLVHDRPIATRCDDSVTRVLRGAPVFIRRSRGAAPRSLPLARPVPVPVLAVGGHLKNTFCLLKGSRAFLSHHIGDLENADAYRALANGIAHYRALFDAAPGVIAHDLHPDYLSSRLAAELECAEHMAVQHHHAHVASCLAEHGHSGPAIGVVFDGAGLGADHAVWGGEFLLADEVGYRRMAHLGYVGLPGGDAAARQPWRMAAAHLWNAYDGDIDGVRPGLEEAAGAARWRMVLQMLEHGTRCPPTSSMGRLFDAVASLADVRHAAQYEGQAAMELEALADPTERSSYPAELLDGDDGWVVDTRPLIRGVVDDIARGHGAARIAGAFHNAVRDVTTQVAERIRDHTGVATVALTGGVFQNVLLTSRIAEALEQRSFEVLIHRLVPCNDGGLSLGQAVIAGHTCLASQQQQALSVTASCA